MEREVLRHFLNSGPTRKFDVRLLTARARLEDPEVEALFGIEFLNRSIIFKHLCVDRDGALDEYPIKTLIYLPYDLVKPWEGGESFVYSPQNFRAFCQYKLDIGMIDQARLDRDVARLDTLNALPALNPFLIEDAFDKVGAELPRHYLELTPEQVAEIRGRIRARLRPLVVAAMPTTTAGGLSEALNRMVERFLRPRSIDDIRPLVVALRLPEETAFEILSAWTGITFFEHELFAIEPRLKAFARWFACHSQPRETVFGPEAERLTEASAFIRKRIREDWARAGRIIGEYQSSYRALLDKDGADLSAFIEFLHGSRGHYWTIGDVLGKLEQAIYAWARFTKAYPNQALPYNDLAEFYKVLCQSYRADALPVGGDDPANARQAELIEFG